jgi:hypothetical protein
MGTVNFENETASGWQQANFPAPIAIVKDTTYVASYYSPLGYYAYTRPGFADATYNDPLTALQSTEESKNGSYKLGNAFPDSHYVTSSNYWVDVVFEASAPTPPTPTNITIQQQACATQQRLSITTAAPATCRYCKASASCDLDTTYDDMTHFTVTGGDTVHHSVDISQSCSASQTYWMRCMDSNLNKDTTSTEATVTTDAAKTVSLTGGTKTLGVGTGTLTVTIIP